MIIDRFTGRYRFLSNFQSVPIVWRGRRWPTVEHAFQAEKLYGLFDELPGLESWYNCIREAALPHLAKLYAREAPMWRSDWMSVRVETMRALLALKFVEKNSFGRGLVVTGEALLVEGNEWHDTFWGCCYCEQHAERGENVLGKLLMERRAQLLDSTVTILPAKTP
jgi:ribA/ribD-fused uncharacterized protein